MKSKTPRPRVLLVDDYPDARDMYGEYLEHVGFRILECGDGQTAVDIARQEMPAAIVMDLSLPVLDGWQATRILKNDPATACKAAVNYINANAKLTSSINATAFCAQGGNDARDADTA